MISVSNDFINEITNKGKTKDTLIKYEGKKVLPEMVKLSFLGDLFKTIMKTADIEMKNSENIIDKNIEISNGLLINGEFEYVNYGTYKIKECEDVAKENKIRAVGCDKMINFMTTYDINKLDLLFPTTVLGLVKASCKYCEVELYSENFYNSDLIIEEDFFSILNVTHRDVLEQVCQVSLTTAIIKDDKLYFKKIEDTGLKIGPSILKSLNLKGKFGPCNSLVLGRGSTEDNIVSKDMQSILDNKLCEIRFDENEIIDKRREQVIDNMFRQIKGFEYNTFEATDLGIGILEPCDIIQVEDLKGKQNNVLVLNSSTTITSGTKGELSSEMPSYATTNYKYTTDSEKRTLKVERYASKQEGQIKDIIEHQTKYEEKITKVEQDIDSINQKVENTVDFKRTIESTNQLLVKEAKEGNLLNFELSGIKEYNNYLFPSEDLFPSENLFPNMEVLQ